MKFKLRTILGAGAAALALAAALLGAFWPSAPAAEETWTRAEPGEYVLGEYGGCVAVYRPEDTVLPEQVTDIEIRLLPAADRRELAEGIVVQTREELLLLLEDLGS